MPRRPRRGARRRGVRARRRRARHVRHRGRARHARGHPPAARRAGGLRRLLPAQGARKRAARGQGLADGLGERRDPDVAIEAAGGAGRRSSPRRPRPASTGLRGASSAPSRRRQRDAWRAALAQRRRRAAAAPSRLPGAGRGGAGSEGQAGQAASIPTAPFAENARRIVAVRLDELYALAPKALDVGRGEEAARHADRGQAAALRAGDRASRRSGRAPPTACATAKTLQELLGDIHDCDEMLPRVQAHAAGCAARTWTT